MRCKGLQPEFQYHKEMKKLFILPLLLLLILSTACCGKTECETSKNSETMCENKVSSEDLAGISKALDLYVNAAVEGTSQVARPAFVEGATITHVENDSIICLPIQALFDYYDETGKQTASYEISDCNVAGDVAMVRIESKFGDAEFSDMFTLAKEGNDWKIVSKIFTVK